MPSLIRRRRYGVEFKAGDAPGITKSLRIALRDLRLDRAWIACPGRQSYRVDERVEVVPLHALSRTLARLA